MKLINHFEAEILCARIAARIGLDGVPALAAWVRNWASVHDPDADVHGAITGLPLDMAVTELLRRSSICRAVVPEMAEYDEVVVLGASATGMWRRFSSIDECLVRAETLTVLAGRRPHLRGGGGGRDGDLAALVGVGGPFPAAAGWRAPQRCAGTDQAAAKEDWAGAAAFAPDETALALLLLDRRWPTGGRDGAPAPLTTLRDGRSVVGDITGHPDGTLERSGIDGRFTRVLVLDGRAVLRRNGPPRPTTRSTLTEWVVRGAGASAGSRRQVLIVSGQPHLTRVARIVEELDVEARLHVDVEVTGPAAPDRVSGALVLRELVDASVPPKRAGCAR